jgi:hypothetical protein
MEIKSLKELFDKYILIWIWSIFIGINSALSMNIFNLYNPARWEQLNSVLIPIYILAVVMALASWLSLFKFFQIKILSIVLPGRNRKELEESEDWQVANNKYAYFQIRRSFYFIIFAIFFRFLIPIAEMIFGLIYG